MFKQLIPIIEVIKANKIIKKEINKEDDEDETKLGVDLEEIDVKYLVEDYRDAIELKNRFEDKAKTILATLTIAVTLILNLSKIIDSISVRYNSIVIDILLFVLSIMAIIYMLIAGIMSIQVLIKENIYYPISLEDRAKQDKKSINEKIETNQHQNRIRNNIIYGSYLSIRNSVICLIIIFIFAVFPVNINKSSTINKNNTFSRSDIVFSSEAVEWIHKNNQKNISFSNIISNNQKVLNAGTKKNIYDKDNSIIITISCKDGRYLIERIISNIEGIN